MGLAHYMEAEFVEEAELMRARLASALETAEPTTPERPGADEEQTLSEMMVPDGPTPPRRRAFAWAALLALAAGIAWVSLRTLSSSAPLPVRADAATAVEPSSAASDAASPVVVEPRRAAGIAEPVAAAEDEPGGESSAAEPRGTSEQGEAVRRSRVRRRHRPARPRPRIPTPTIPAIPALDRIDGQ